MAQKTEKEETEFKVPETLSLCINNCGFTGNPATNNMCQNCFKSTTATPSNTTSTTVKTSASAVLSPHKLAKPFRSSLNRSRERSNSPAETSKDVAPQDRRSDGDEAPPPAKREVNRCSGCRRKVGLTGFRCRCGDLFCPEHRYSDRHDCSFDYKTAGRETISRENPVVKAAKIVRI
ncbi:Zinc finger, AN1-type [Dillenia turbinata]|uniref:Zinc finger, AN1-type n=1 Tax=Dillenia turbinata TaxID=194707 RepID=A0AAN8ZGP3_9MAGN